MIKESYVSFKTAKLLKEKGFDEPCYLGYNKNGEYFPTGGRNNSQIIQPDFCFICCPTLQMAMKWLREVHNIHINLDIHWLHFANKNGWMYIIVRILENGTEFVDAKGDSNDQHFYSTYEEACETAIQYSLKNLID